LLEVADLPIASLRDPTWERTKGVLKGRDGCRVPLPWTRVTPVIAYDRGSMAELIDHGTTGYLVRDVDDASRAVDAVSTLDREAIRACTVKRLDRKRMIDAYSALYSTVLSRQ